MKKFTALFLCSVLLNISLFSDEKRFASYTAQKHKVDFYKQEEKLKMIFLFRCQKWQNIITV